MSSPESAALPGRRPAARLRFLFEVDGVEIGIFASVRGLQVTVADRGHRRGWPERLRAPDARPAGVAEHRVQPRADRGDALFDWMNKTSGEGFAAAGQQADPVDRRDHRDRRRRQTGCVPGSSTTCCRCAGRARTSTSATDSPLTEELEIAHHGFRSFNAERVTDVPTAEPPGRGSADPARWLRDRARPCPGSVCRWPGAGRRPDPEATHGRRRWAVRRYGGQAGSRPGWGGHLGFGGNSPDR